VPMQGRAIAGGKYRQGDVMESWRRRLAWDGCPDKPDSEVTRDTMTCQTWNAGSCKSGHAMELCLHPGEHEIVPRWVVAGFRFMERMARE
jgi:polyhydroxybutyrate depolymerase